MDKERIASWIDNIVIDTTDSHKTLEDCLRKTLVLAYNLKNDKLKAWVNGELNGYSSIETLPEYRFVGFEIWGNLIQSLLGTALTRTASLYYHTSNHAYFVDLQKGYPLKSSVAVLESIVKQRGQGDLVGNLTFTMNPYLVRALNEEYENWTIEKAWIQVSEVTVTEILSLIKNNLLQFLLALNEEVGNDNNFTIMNSPEKVDRIIEHTIGHIHAENVTFGNSYQTKGDQNNVVQGNNNSQQIASAETLLTELKQLTEQIKELLDKATDLEPDTREDIAHQVVIVERQIAKEKPKFDLIGQSMKMIETLLLDAVTSEYTPLILDGIRRVYTQLASIN